jgi:hypothetical protein
MSGCCFRLCNHLRLVASFSMTITLEGPPPDFEVGMANTGSHACDNGVADIG